MHRLEDMRVLQDRWDLTVVERGVDRDGQPTGWEDEDTCYSADPEAARKWDSELYRCDACDMEFHSWVAAKDHIDFDADD